jgi:hypothetical protein
VGVLVFGPTPKSPIPNPQSPIPINNPYLNILIYIYNKLLIKKIIIIKK